MSVLKLPELKRSKSNTFQAFFAARLLSIMRLLFFKYGIRPCLIHYLFNDIQNICIHKLVFHLCQTFVIIWWGWSVCCWKTKTTNIRATLNGTVTFTPRHQRLKIRGARLASNFSAKLYLEMLRSHKKRS